MLDLTNLIFELKALRTKLCEATYAATFAPDMGQRADAAQQAKALQLTIEGVLAKSWNAAERITTFVRSPARENRLVTLNEYVHLLEQLEHDEEQQLPMGSTPYDGQYQAMLASPKGGW